MFQNIFMIIRNSCFIKVKNIRWKILNENKTRVLSCHSAIQHSFTVLKCCLFFFFNFCYVSEARLTKLVEMIVTDDS